MEINSLHDYQLEELVLGAVIYEFNILPNLPEWNEEIFFKPIHKTIAFTINTLFKQGSPIDIGTLSAALKSAGKLDEVGGNYFIATLTRSVASSDNTEYHYRKLQELYFLRKLAEIGHELKVHTLQNLADPFDLIEKFENKIKALTSGLNNQELTHISKLNENALKRLENINNGSIQSGTFTGFTKIQSHFGGWQKGELIILAARPAMGKTALAIQLLLQPALQQNIPVAFFSVEMGENPILSRVQSILTGYSAQNLIRGNVTKGDIDSIKLGTHSLYKTPIYIDTTPAINIYEFIQKCRKLKKDKKIELIVIDYLQLMKISLRSGNREQEISTISRTLKETAKELDIPIICLSQLSREVEKRNSKRPMLSDLRESGAIEQDADVVMFIHRPEYYNENQFEDGSDAAGQAELIISKNRNGSCGFIKLGFEAHNVKFYDLDTHGELQPNTDF